MTAGVVKEGNSVAAFGNGQSRFRNRSIQLEACIVIDKARVGM
jgi:hypothetical protein